MIIAHNSKILKSQNILCSYTHDTVTKKGGIFTLYHTAGHQYGQGTIARLS